jgi:hypothetical protein
VLQEELQCSIEIGSHHKVRLPSGALVATLPSTSASRDGLLNCVSSIRRNLIDKGVNEAKVKQVIGRIKNQAY